MNIKARLRGWLSERETFSNGVRSRYTRGQTIVGQMLCLVALALLMSVAALVLVVLPSLLGNSGHTSIGGVAAHGVKLAILSLL
ncbi:hypothetical protein LA345_40535 (plasmid) [Burkholderia vietnamiensis]|uniref:Uncharacterized protein n=1 Tax=Burkholderia vietnamiensis (strain G4 / LMG 22486) TaxID=269482 RepID=A4JU06_BURVG|nr:hypothetical protein Bcep1808_6872 [Burkholderia vietnamiensis G4]MCB4350083.1 hypothetical protein [Burkholderia vietnamiensis]